MPTVTSTVQFEELFTQAADLMKEYSFTIVTFLDIESGSMHQPHLLHRLPLLHSK
jgi:hypothetical protein